MVLNESGNNDDIILFGNMRYFEDWYGWIPSTLPTHPLPIDWYSWLSEIDFDNWKSQLVVESVE
ncbi:MAG: hypothetical protein IPM74_07405 [Crocinitomicaceae bacterium]|nr:hypothetical protein [Crocinitomicaceae bacterium]MBK8925726.1 hypothetical protein [Crocinitomicaceae bacterium]